MSSLSNVGQPSLRLGRAEAVRQRSQLFSTSSKGRNFGSSVALGFDPGRPLGVNKLLRVHVELLHVQLRISGRSWPCLSMYWLCSISLSLSCCFR
jgi:hypothetical protein